MAATARRNVLRHRCAWCLATALLFSCVFESSSARYRAAFVALSPSLSFKSDGLQLPSECLVQAVGRNRASRRRNIKTTCAKAAAEYTTAVEEEETELRLLTWMEVEARIERDIAEVGTAAVIVPVGATEQHGPNGLIGTDHMTAEAVARGVSEATGTLLAPCINYGMSFHHGSFPGTVSLSPATFVGVVRDVASSLSKTGFTHVLFINGHGGNVGPTYKAFADLAAAEEQRRREENETASATAAETAVIAAAGDGRQGQAGGGSDDHDSDSNSASRTRLKLISWYAGRESSALAKDLYAGEIGQHATPDEVAMTQHLFPRSIKAGVELDPAAIQVAKDLGGMTKRAKDEETGLSVMDTEDFRRRFPDGRMFSNPGLATPEHGRRLLNAAVRDATEALGKFISGVDLVEEAEAAAKRAAEAAATTEGTPFKQKQRWGKDKTGSTRSARHGKGRWGDAGISGGAESRVVGMATGVTAEGKEVAAMAGGGGNSKASAERGRALGRIPGKGRGGKKATQPS